MRTSELERKNLFTNALMVVRNDRGERDITGVADLASAVVARLYADFQELFRNVNTRTRNGDMP